MRDDDDRKDDDYQRKAGDLGINKGMVNLFCSWARGGIIVVFFKEIQLVVVWLIMQWGWGWQK